MIYHEVLSEGGAMHDELEAYYSSSSVNTYNLLTSHSKIRKIKMSVRKVGSASKSRAPLHRSLMISNGERYILRITLLTLEYALCR
jgi:hypothetical protein